MGFGKRVCEILAVIGAIVLIGILVWYLSSGMSRISCFCDRSRIHDIWGTGDTKER